MSEDRESWRRQARGRTTQSPTSMRPIWARACRSTMSAGIAGEFGNSSAATSCWRPTALSSRNSPRTKRSSRTRHPIWRHSAWPPVSLSNPAFGTTVNAEKHQGCGSQPSCCGVRIVRCILEPASARTRRLTFSFVAAILRRHHRFDPNRAKAGRTRKNFPGHEQPLQRRRHRGPLRSGAGQTPPRHVHGHHAAKSPCPGSRRQLGRRSALRACARGRGHTAHGRLGRGQ